MYIYIYIYICVCIIYIYIYIYKIYILNKSFLSILYSIRFDIIIKKLTYKIINKINLKYNTLKFIYIIAIINL